VISCSLIICAARRSDWRGRTVATWVLAISPAEIDPDAPDASATSPLGDDSPKADIAFRDIAETDDAMDAMLGRPTRSYSTRRAHGFAKRSKSTSSAGR